MVRLLRAQPFESETLDRLAETMKVTPILKKEKLGRYYKRAPFARGCASYPDAILFDAKYFDMLSPNEVLAVGAHEFNHIKKKHPVKTMNRTLLPAILIGVLIGGFSIINYLAVQTLGSLLNNLDRLTNIASPPVLIALFVLVVSFYFNSKLFRQQETECDLSAVEYADGEAMISALIKFRKRFPKLSLDAKLSKLMPHTYPTHEQRKIDIQIAMANKKSN